jgi:hypothetical protein
MGQIYNPSSLMSMEFIKLMDSQRTHACTALPTCAVHAPERLARQLADEDRVAAQGLHSINRDAKGELLQALEGPSSPLVHFQSFIHPSLAFFL